MLDTIDILNRDDFLNKTITIINSLNQQKIGSCFSIDGKWGTGKSHILNILKERLSKIQSEETCDSKYFIITYNCWEHDYYEEPLIAIIASIQEQLEKELAVFSPTIDNELKSLFAVAKSNLLHAANAYLKAQTNCDLEKLYKDIKESSNNFKVNENSFDLFSAFKNTLSNVTSELDKISKHKSIIMLVDELDRCHPEYALKILERIHHVSNNMPYCTVILSMDSAQIEHSIRQIFGDKVDIEKYLKKFVDFSINLDSGTISNNFIEKYDNYFSYFKSPKRREEKKFFTSLFYNLFNDLDIRTQEKLLDKAFMIHKIVSPDRSKSDLSLLCFELICIRLNYSNYQSMFLTWLTSIIKDIPIELSNQFSKTLLTFFDIQLQKISNNHMIESYYICDTSLPDKSFWLLSSLLQDSSMSHIAGNLYMEKPKRLKTEQLCAVQFYSFLNFIH